MKSGYLKSKKPRSHVKKSKIDDIKVYNDIRAAALNGCNLQQCAQAANITEATLYNYFKKDPDFKDKINSWRQNVNIKAKHNIARAIDDGDVDLSFNVLCKTDPDFKVNNNNTTFNAQFNNNNNNTVVIDSLESLIKYVSSSVPSSSIIEEELIDGN